MPGSITVSMTTFTHHLRFIAEAARQCDLLVFLNCH
jgi:creatinine amidohydrolase/Fe(II)-dependent formamide hydrolase-like protein